MLDLTSVATIGRSSNPPILNLLRNDFKTPLLLLLYRVSHIEMALMNCHFNMRYPVGFIWLCVFVMFDTYVMSEAKKNKQLVWGPMTL